MRFKGVSVCGLALMAGVMWAQETEMRGNVPVYKLTVVGQTIPAINYQHRSGPTEIGFRGTALIPYARGRAIVESKRGSTVIDAFFERFPAPNRFGAQFLTYVLWAITPDGRAINLGELVLNPSDKGKLHVTTDMQSFGLIVTAEPYYAVTQPSEAVVAENFVKPDTIGNVEQVAAKVELLRRGELHVVQPPPPAPLEGTPLRMNRYEAALEIYEAQNAVQMARAEGADRYATGSMQKADSLLRNAQDLQVSKGDTKTIVMLARESAEAAADARNITRIHADQERIAQEQQAAAQQDAQATKDALLTAHQAREEMEEMRARQEAAGVRIVPEPYSTQSAPSAGIVTSRAAFLGQLSQLAPCRDTGKALVIQLMEQPFEPDRAFLTPAGSQMMARIAEAISERPNLKVEVEGYGIRNNDQPLMSQRAALVAGDLRARGIAATSMSAIGIEVKPRTDAWPRGRQVEIVISGDFAPVVSARAAGR